MVGNLNPPVSQCLKFTKKSLISQIFDFSRQNYEVFHFNLWGENSNVMLKMRLFLGDFHPLCLFGVWIGNEERRRGWRKIGKIYSKEKYYIAVDKAIHT